MTVTQVCDGDRAKQPPLPMNLHLDVIAEGVETAEQFSLLQKLQCKYGQGYYFSRPVFPQKEQRPCC